MCIKVSGMNSLKNHNIVKEGRHTHIHTYKHTHESEQLNEGLNVGSISPQSVCQFLALQIPHYAKH